MIELKGLTEDVDLRTTPWWVEAWHRGYQTDNFGILGGRLNGWTRIEKAERLYKTLLNPPDVKACSLN